MTTRVWGRIGPASETGQNATVEVTFAKATVMAMYTNWRGERALREFMPIRAYYGSNRWHPTMQWLLEVFDQDKQEIRVYSFAGLGWTAPEAPGKEGSD